MQQHLVSSGRDVRAFERAFRAHFRTSKPASHPPATRHIATNVAARPSPPGFTTMSNLVNAPARLSEPRQSVTLVNGEDYRIQANVELSAVPSALLKQCTLFYTNEMEGLAKKIAAHAGGNIKLGKIRWK